MRDANKNLFEESVSESSTSVTNVVDYSRHLAELQYECSVLIAFQYLGFPPGSIALGPTVEATRQNTTTNITFENENSTRR